MGGASVPSVTSQWADFQSMYNHTLSKKRLCKQKNEGMDMSLSLVNIGEVKMFTKLCAIFFWLNI